MIIDHFVLYFCVIALCDLSLCTMQHISYLFVVLVANEKERLLSKMAGTALCKFPVPFMLDTL